jgi:serine/threonine-protein kinase
MAEPAHTVVQLVPGTVFHDRYDVVRCIRAGGMGAVYEVSDRGTGRRRALKTMLPNLLGDADSRARFELEARVTAEVDSVHLVEVLDAGVDDATAMPFLVMELLKGEDLGSMLSRKGKLAPTEVVAFLHQAALGLDRTHAAGIVHRDLKPENLFVTRRDDGSPHVKILDFGVAKVVVSATEARTTRSVGTPVYMAPEQIRGEGDIGPRADLYALGHIAYTLLTGRTYYADVVGSSGGIYAVLLAVVEGAREPASVRAAREGVELPPAIDAWFESATAAIPSDRFDHASAMIDELALALDVPVPRPSAVVELQGGGADLGRSLTAGGVSREAPRPPRSRVGLVLGGAALLGTIALIATRRGDEPSPPTLAPTVPPAAASSTSPAPTAPPAPASAVATQEAVPAATASAAPAPRPPRSTPTAAATASAPPIAPPKDPTRIR